MKRSFVVASLMVAQVACGRDAGPDEALVDASAPSSVDSGADAAAQGPADAGDEPVGDASDASAGDAGPDAAVDAGTDGSLDDCRGGELESRSCGLNARGLQARSCSEGSWTEWSTCVDPDQCVDAAREQQRCGVAQGGVSTRVCVEGAWSSWSACDDPDACSEGDRQQQACGLNERGEMSRACVSGLWGSWSACFDPDVCADGVQGQRACGLNGRGTATRSCDAGSWSAWSLCTDVDECADAQDEQVPCGLNQRGRSARTCAAGHWSDWSSCTDPDACVDGSEAQQVCGLNQRGSAARTCGAGQWGEWSSCADPDACLDGAAEASVCGLNQRGLSSRSCQGGSWTPWSGCVDPDECVDAAGEQRACGLNQRGLAGRLCERGNWGEWSSCEDGDDCVDGTEQEFSCGLNGRGISTRTCVEGAWESPTACEDPDECVDGRTRSVACGTDDSGSALETCESGRFIQSTSCACAWGTVMDCAGRCASLPARLHVRASATGCEDGRTWETAFSDLSSALVARPYEIWVAEGTYYPGAPGAAITSTFAVDYPVWLFGGFAGHEASVEERDIAAHPSVLDGDLDRDGMVDLQSAQHVVTLGASARLDGFTVQHGYASDASYDRPEGGRSGQGGGVLIDRASPTIENCRIIENWAVLGGGGMYIRGESEARISRSVFERNRAVIQFVANGGTHGNGGALDMDEWPGPEGLSRPYIADCDFDANQADNAGGAMRLGRTHVTLVNSLFRQNVARGGGGAIDMRFDAEPTISQCTFVGNRASTSSRGGALYAWWGVWATVSNSIFWDNGSSPVRPVQTNNAPTSRILVTSSIVQNGYTGSGNSQSDPLLDDALRPGAGSPALNTAAAPSLPADRADLDRDGDTSEPLPLDHRGAPRVQGFAPDMGAFEVSGPL